MVYVCEPWFVYHASPFSDCCFFDFPKLLGYPFKRSKDDCHILSSSICTTWEKEYLVFGVRNVFAHLDLNLGSCIVNQTTVHWSINDKPHLRRKHCQAATQNTSNSNADWNTAKFPNLVKPTRTPKFANFPMLNQPEDSPAGHQQTGCRISEAPTMEATEVDFQNASTEKCMFVPAVWVGAGRLDLAVYNSYSPHLNWKQSIHFSRAYSSHLSLRERKQLTQWIKQFMPLPAG